MKTLVVAVVILGSSLFNNTFASGLDINKELRKVIKFENNQLPIEVNKTEFVKVSFTINKDGKVEILGMNFSDEDVKNQLIEKLSEIHIEQKYNSKEVYNYNFTFKKM